ncbi:cell division protein FtsL [Mesorhizobium xinjiangense]|uniref:cell division protein FtsL n=1 Tax=Mesorhizobium xinjiangense TaxID=2678685 RepID=UPI001F3B108C|nr:hypothetical protein [Mesorhizobium xinjiangense]
MFRTTDIVLIAVMVSAAAFTYKTKHEAEDQLTAVRKLQKQIQLEEETIDLLEADWSLLTQPSRLQKLANAYQEQLELEPIEAERIVDIDDIPNKPPQIEPPDGEAIARTEERGTDRGIITGSTTR